MNVHTRAADVAEARSTAKAGIIDCDIHPSLKSKADLKPFLSERWWKHYDTYGSLVRQPLSTYLPYPRMQPDTARRDAWPPGGGPPASDLAFMREQHLDANNIIHGILHPLRIGGYDQRNLDFGAALCGAINDWQLQAWAEPEPRLKASIYIPQDFPEAAAAEIERRASNPHFVQITTASFASEPLGHRRYWPIFAAAQAADIAIGMHIGGYSGQAITAGGWPSFYYEHHYANSPAIEAVVTSLVMEGVFERFPRLRVVLVEAGFVWVPLAVLAARSPVGTHARRGPAPHAPAVGIHPAEHLVHDAADRGAGRPGSPQGNNRLDRLGPSVVLNRLSALGLRRPKLRVQVQDERGATRRVVPRQCRARLSVGGLAGAAEYASLYLGALTRCASAPVNAPSGRVSSSRIEKW